VDNNKHNVEFIALNLTDEEFKGFCKGMEMIYLRRSMTKRDSRHANKSMGWWDSAYDKYRHNCKG